MVAKNRLFADAKGIGRPSGIRQHAAMVHHHALGVAGGAGGKNGIGRIRIDHTATHRLQKLRLCLTGRQRFCAIHLAVIIQSGRVILVGLVTDQYRRLQGAQNLIHPLGGHFRIQHHIEVAAVQHPHQGHQTGCAPLHQHRHRAISISISGQRTAHGFGNVHHRLVVIAALLICKGGLPWQTCRSAFQ